jgi:predicted nucleic acid-binding protein
LLAAARDEIDFTALARALAALPQAPVTTSACGAAIAASRDLRGSRRLPAADYLIAAAAAERGFGVLHEERHFDTLASVLGFPSVRLTL